MSSSAVNEIITESKNEDESFLTNTDGSNLQDRLELLGKNGSWQWNITTGHVQCSEGLVNLIGFPLPPDTGVSTLFRALLRRVHYKDREQVTAGFEKLNASKNLCGLPFRITDKYGNSKQVICSTELSKQSGERVCLGVLQDISVIQEERTNEVRFKEVFDTLDDVFIGSNPEGIIQMISPSCERLFGVAPSVMTGVPAMVWYANPSDRRRLVEMVEEFGVVRNFRTEILTEAGNKKEVLVTAKLVRNEKGNYMGVQSVIRDISELKRAEEELEENQMLLEALLNTFPDEVYFKNRQNEFIRASQSVAKKYGLDSPKELYGLTELELGSDALAEKKFQEELVVIKTGNPIIDRIEEDQLADGHTSWMSTTRMPLFNTKGRIIGSFGVRRDITHQIQIQEQLMLEREKFSATFEYAAVGIAHLSLDGHYLRVNKKYEDILGYSFDELSATTFQAITHPEDLEKDVKLGEELLAGHITQSVLEKRYIRKDGSIFWARVTGSLVRDSDNQEPLYHIAVLEDISEIKEAEKHLSEQKHLMESIIQQSSEGIAAMDANMNFILWNKMAVNFIGPEIQEKSEKKWYQSYEAYHPDKETLFELKDIPFVKALKEGQIVRSEMYVKNRAKSDGTFLKVSASPLKNTEGEVLGCIAILNDITEARKISDQLTKSEKKFRELIETAPDGFILTDLAGRIVLVNSQAEQLLGYDRKDLLTIQITSLFEEGLLLHGTINELNSKRKYSHVSKITCVRKTNDTFYASLGIGLLETEDDYLISFSIKDISDLVEKEASTKIDIFKAEDRERTRIAHDLHDGLGQSIAAAYLFINSLSEAVNAALDKETAKRFNTCVELINKSVLETRLISHNIMPSSLKHFGIKQAVEELVVNINTLNEGTSIVCQGNVEDQRFEERVELAVYRAIQEIINNALKHAKAKTLYIDLHVTKNLLTVKTVDDGVGFDSQTKSAGLGLESVRNRIESFDGKVALESVPGSGTKYSIQIPLKNKVG